MHFELNDDQKLIRKTVADFVKKELTLERMRKMRDDEIGFSREIYRQMGELGWLGIHLPEAAGGFGGSFVDASIILEQFGGALVSEPFTESVVVAARAVLAGPSERWEALLGSALAGDTVMSLAWLEADQRYDVTRVATTATRREKGFHIAGAKRWVLAGNAADIFIVSARMAGEPGDRNGVALFAVPADAGGVTVKAVKTMDGRRAAMVDFDVTVATDALLVSGDGDRAVAALEAALDYGAAAACAEGYGVMKASLEMTLEYLKTREQFGKKIGVFQALQHRAVDMFVQTELAKSTAILAAIRVDAQDSEERQRAVSVAKARLATAGKFVTQQATQLHGGIGVTDEHDIGLYFKRMQILSTLYGDEAFHVRRFAGLPGFIPEEMSDKTTA
ncbi:MAG: acyl-CoA dehydrogenase family protein [Myxococcota bacterium]